MLHSWRGQTRLRGEALFLAALLAASLPVVAAAQNGPPEEARTRLSQCIGSDRNVKIGTAPCRNVVVDRSFKGPDALGRIEIGPAGDLLIPDATLSIETTGIEVRGRLRAGTRARPIGTDDPANRVTLTFTGARPCDGPDACNGFNKGISVEAGGTLHLFGARGVPPAGVSWTHLAAPAGPAAEYGAGTGTKRPVPADGATTLTLDDDVTIGPGAWRVGDWIAVATTSFSPVETEFVQIRSLRHLPANRGSEITLEQSLRHYHFGGLDPGPPGRDNFDAGAARNYGVDERAEVALVTRSIALTARIEPGAKNLHWGGELMIHSGFDDVAIQGVELEKFGKDQRGSYPIHFHMAGDASRRSVTVDANTIHHSFNKCVTIHETSGVTLTDNVCARIVGHMFYQEIGSEKNIRYARNLGLGAMSNSFDIHAKTAAQRQSLIDQYWWDGDHLGRTGSPSYNGYDGFNIPNTDNPENPTHGSCYRPRADGGLEFASEVPCARDTYYTEPAGGFWIIAPGTELVGNSIAGCQGVGRGYWYVPPKDLSTTPPALKNLKFEPIGTFRDNRVHGCYAGLYDETEYSVRSEQLFSHVGGTPEGRPVVAAFNGLTATRNRFRGVWLRPTWLVVRHSRFATNRENVTLVSSGGLDGNAPGVWALLQDSVLVGVSENNVDRFGPCPDDNQFGPQTGGQFGCIDQTPIPTAQPRRGADEVGEGYPPPRWNFFGYMLYDGPVRVFDDRFVNFNVDISQHLTKKDQAFLARYTNGRTLPNSNQPWVYEGDASLGWFQSNQSSYPTSTAVRGLRFENTDLRHQIYTENVNLAQFNDGDQNTAVLDEDGSLTGFRVVRPNGLPAPGAFPISLNNLPFNQASNAVNECLSEGGQDAVLEGRPTSVISPASMATLEFQALFPGDKVTTHTQLLTFTKDSPELGARPEMTLHSRDGRGVWEPKVASGYGYTVHAAPDPVRNPGATGGIPARLDVGVLDLVKPKVSPDDPFYVRLGICYTNASGGHPTNPAAFSIVRGHKSYGGDNVDTRDPALRVFWNKLDNRYKHQVCIDLDDSNRRNLDPVNGCPADGVTAVPRGGCPAPSVAGVDDQQQPACIYPKAPLSRVASIDGLTRDGKPELGKFFYEAGSGMLYFYVAQERPNAFGPSPLGTCDGQRPEDPSCPDLAHGESYYACPPEGCTTYVVRLDDASYAPGPSNCSPYPAYAQDPPDDELVLADAITGAIVQRKQPAGGGTGGRFPHWEPTVAPRCATTTPDR